MRINGFEQIKGFYSWVFENQEKNVRTTHISLYMFLLNQNNRNKWVEWFKCPFDLAMGGSGITNKNTYYKTLLDLEDWKLIKYKKGVNNYKAPLIKIEVLFDTATVPQSEPQLQPQVIPLTIPLMQPQMANNIKQLTNNIEPITLNIFKVLDFLKLNNDEQEGGQEDMQVNKPYSEKEFLSDWNVKRKKILNKDSFLNRLDLESKSNLKDLIKAYKPEQIRFALTGLFKQKKLPNGNTSMQSNPMHFLKYFDSYLQAYYDKNNSLYGKPETDKTL